MWYECQFVFLTLKKLLVLFEVLSERVKMKSLILIFLCAFAVCQKLNISKSDNSLSLAFENVTRHLFRLETQMFIKNYGVDQEKLTWLLLKDLNEKGMPFRLQNLEINNKTIEHNSSALLTFNSFQDFRDFNQKVNLTNDYYRPLQLFIYCEDASINDLHHLPQDVIENPLNAREPLYFNRGVDTPWEVIYFRADLMDIIQYEYFLIDEDKFVRLLTFLWYLPGYCGELNLVEINKFNKQTKKWEYNRFFYKKLRNFYNCEIKFYQFTSYESDFPVKIAKILSEHLNYQLEIVLYGTMDVIARRGCYEGFDRTYRGE